MSFRIAISQINPIMGDFSYNTSKIREYAHRAKSIGADLVIFPELSICGHPAHDLLSKGDFIDKCMISFQEVIKTLPDIYTVIGLPWKENSRIYNAAILTKAGAILSVFKKINLNAYGIIEEVKYFERGKEVEVFNLNDLQLSVIISNDILDHAIRKKIEEAKPNLVINLWSYPFYINELNERISVLLDLSNEFKVTLVQVNMVGGQDEIVFGGNSLVIGSDQSKYKIVKSLSFEETISYFDFDSETGQIIKMQNLTEAQLEQSEEHLVPNLFKAITLGIKDYVTKSGFQKALVGVSGGIDSALVLCLAEAALGAQNVVAVTMPSPFTSRETLEDAFQLIRNLGVQHIHLPIGRLFECYLEELGPILRTREGVAIENIQARIRANILLALSNQFGYMVLTTGNKSEVLTGYCTIYGDTAGSLAVLSDIPKYMVYRLADFVNKRGDKAIIPHSIIQRPPTAELKPNQRDEDTLPPYPTLDRILEAYVDKNLCVAEIEKTGIPIDHIQRTLYLYYQSEYKRRQLPLGLRVYKNSLLSGIRVPVVNHYRGF